MYQFIKFVLRGQKKHINTKKLRESGVVYIKAASPQEKNINHPMALPVNGPVLRAVARRNPVAHY